MDEIYFHFYISDIRVQTFGKLLFRENFNMVTFIMPRIIVNGVEI